MLDTPTPASESVAQDVRRTYRSARTVALLDLEPDLVEDLPAPEYDALRRELQVAVLHLPRGRWTPPAGLERALALLVVEGLLTREAEAAGCPATQLLGPGDIVDARALAPHTTSWHARSPVTVAVVDARLLLVARRWPQVGVGWTHRLLDAQHEQHVLATIRGLPRVEDRVTTYISHLAGRWGRVTPDGLTVDLPLTHELLGQLVGARRPTVSLALTMLRQTGTLRRLDDGRWLVQQPERRG